MNTFGSAQLQFALYDSREVKANRARFRRGAVPMLDRVNHFYMPSGRWSFRGWVLLDRNSYNQLNQYSDALQLHIGDTTDPNNVGVLQNLSIVQAQCVTRGLASDLSALYLVELTDDRGILLNEWFQAPITASYNIRAPAYPQVFHPGSMNSGTTWTWATMLQNMWNNLNTIDGGNVLGPWPGLPSGVAPTGTPEGFWFQGVDGWQSLNDVLEYLGLYVACDLTQPSPFTIVSAGAADSAFAALQAKYGSASSPLYRLEDDLEWIDVGAARVPLNVTVYFRKRYSVYGTEETVRYDSPQWDMTPLYSVTFQAPTFFTGAVGSHSFWSDFTVRYDQDGNPLAADTATANAIASERVTQYFNRIYRATAGFMTQTYAGALPFKTDSQVDGVCWYMSGDDYSGWRTQIVRGPYPPWPDLWDKGTYLS